MVVKYQTFNRFITEALSFTTVIYNITMSCPVVDNCMLVYIYSSGYTTKEFYYDYHLFIYYMVSIIII